MDRRDCEAVQDVLSEQPGREKRRDFVAQKRGKTPRPVPSLFGLLVGQCQEEQRPLAEDRGRSMHSTEKLRPREGVVRCGKKAGYEPSDLFDQNQGDCGRA